MFPLGTVLVPSQVLPLHLFEPRYRALIRDVLAADREFGVCLIERGSEVGGGDVRLPVATMAAVHEATELPDGRWAVVAVGTRRIRVTDWLADDPYPRAKIEDFPDPVPGPLEVEQLSEVVELLRSVHERLAERGGVDPPEVEISDDAVLASYQVLALAPLGPLDRYQLLCTATVGLRLAAAHDRLVETLALLDG